MNIQIQPKIKTCTIDVAERTRRKKAVDFARGSVRLEGIILTPAMESLNERYINGEMTDAEHVERLLVAAEHE